jgi:hypothetical protein
MGTWVLTDTVAYGLRKTTPAASLPEAKAEGEPPGPMEAEEAEDTVDIRGRRRTTEKQRRCTDS